jgi:hypothetical protein
MANTGPCVTTDAFANYLAANDQEGDRFVGDKEVIPHVIRRYKS